MLIAASKLFGTEKRIIRMFNKKNQPSRFDDDQWHEVILYRDVELVSLSLLPILHQFDIHFLIVFLQLFKFTHVFN